MADKKISALDAIVSIDDADVLPIVDASVSTTKKINVSQVKALAPVQSVASKTGAVTLVKGDVGLGNVDNTADTDKPVSTATQTALNLKQNTLVSGTNIKTINDESILGSGNITISGGGGISDGDKGDITVSASGATWTIDNGAVTDAKVASGIDAVKIADGSVTNTEFQYLGGVTSDIQTQLDAKEPTISAGTTGQYYRGDKTFQTLDKTAVGLSNVDNTSDLNKPISTATQSALDAKQATITGAATTIDTEDLTASRALVSDGSGKVAVSDVTATELGYLDGVTSAVQTQIDTKQATLVSGTNIKTINSTSLLGSGDIAISASPAGVAGAIQFSDGSAFASDATNLFYDDTNDSLGVGINAPTARLHVKGSGTTSATTSLLVQNSAGSTAFQVKDDLNTTLGGSLTLPNFQSILSGTNSITFQSGRTLFGATFNTFAGQYAFDFTAGGGNNTSTSGTLGRFSLEARFAPTSGTAVYNVALIKPTINQTGGANGITRGLFIDTTLTAAADFRAIETTAGNVVFGNLPTSSAGLPSGAIWNDSGTLKIA